MTWGEFKKQVEAGIKAAGVISDIDNLAVAYIDIGHFELDLNVEIDEAGLKVW